MSRRPAAGLFLFLLLAVGVSVAWANPLPWFVVTVEPADQMGGPLIAPGGANPITPCVQTITVKFDNGEPAPDVPVQVVFANDIQMCPGTILSGTTDGNGQLTLAFTGGGCLQNVMQACVVYTDDIPFWEARTVRSPDYDGSDSNLMVNLADLINFAGSYSVAGSGCHDYDGSGQVQLPDLMIFAMAFTRQSSCQ